MNKKTAFRYTFAIAILLPVMAYSKPLTPSEALDRIFMEKSMRMIKKQPTRSKTVLSHTFTSQEGTPLLYAINKGENEGYIITPADDSFPAIIGFGDNGNFDTNNISPSMKWFIEGIASEINYILKHNPEGLHNSAIASNDWDPVEPLIKSKWDQGEPYNLKCPDLELIDTSTGDPTGTKIPTVTGCVATSMAQVMYYHKWPDIGTGSNKYEWKTYSDVLAKTLSYNFSEYRPDWNNMLDTYQTNSRGIPQWNNDQAKAVSDLMYACGVSVNMLYNMEQAGGSGAQSSMQCPALVNYFKYSRGIRHKYRDFCTSGEFEETIYENLRKGLPVLYSGRGAAGGHSFVCDGYAGNHYFHFNWGWSGVSDGYFYLASLNPGELGIGGASGGFNSLQEITYNIIPVRDGIDTGVEEDPYINCVGDFNYYSRSLQKSTTGEQLMFTTFKCQNPIGGYNAGFWNMSGVPFNGYFGLVITKDGGKDQPEFIPCVEANDLVAGSGITSLVAYLETYKEGKYKIKPAMYNSKTNKFDDIHVANGYHSYVTMTVDPDGNRTFKNQDFSEEAEDAPEMAVTCFNYAGELASNVNHDFMISVSNYSSDNDYYGDMTLLLKNSKGKVLTTLPLGTYNVPSGISIPYTFNIAFDLLSNTYTVAFRDKYGRELPGEYPLTISKKGSALKTQLRVMAFSPIDMLPKTTVSKVTFQVGNYGSTNITNPKFYFVWNKVGESAKKSVSAQYNVTLNANTYMNFQLMNIPFKFDEGLYELTVCTPASATDNTLTPISQTIYIRAGYPVETVSVGESGECSICIGETKSVKATLTPQNATFSILSWSSSNPDVATVDSNGNIKGVSEGHAYVTATAYNGANDTVLVNVVGTSSSVTGIDAIKDDILEVYNVNGIKILDKTTHSKLNILNKGIYIIKTANGNYKIKI